MAQAQPAPLTQDTPPVIPPEREDMIETDQGSLGNLKGVRYEVRDENLNLVREFGFAERISGSQGLFEISDPWIKFYGKNRQIIEINAPRGSVPLKIVDGQLQEPSHGALEGGVTIEIYRPDPNSPTTPDAEPTRLRDDRGGR